MGSELTNLTSDHRRKEIYVRERWEKSLVMVKHAPMLMLSGAVVTKVLGFEHEEPLPLGRAAAGLTPYSKGVPLGSSSRTPRRSKNSAGR